MKATYLNPFKKKQKKKQIFEIHSKWFTKNIMYANTWNFQFLNYSYSSSQLEDSFVPV